MLKNIRDYGKIGSERARYIPILDRDPVYAAKFLTKKDLLKSYELLLKVFDEIRRGEKYHDIMYDTVMDSSSNFHWFIKFFKAMEEAIGIPEEERFKNLPEDKCPYNIDSAPTVQQPFHYTSGASYYSTNVKDKIPINNYRIRYIVEDHDLIEFQEEQFPAWYILKNTTIYEKYNEKTNTRVRIDFRDGYFLYFLAGASDNWQMIPEVPIEMDHIISALLFKSLD